MKKIFQLYLYIFIIFAALPINAMNENDSTDCSSDSDSDSVSSDFERSLRRVMALQRKNNNENIESAKIVKMLEQSTAIKLSLLSVPVVKNEDNNIASQKLNPASCSSNNNDDADDENSKVEEDSNPNKKICRRKNKN